MRIVIKHVYLQKTCEKVQLKLHDFTLVTWQIDKIMSHSQKTYGL